MKMESNLIIEFDNGCATMMVRESSVDDGSKCIEFITRYENKYQCDTDFYISNKEELEDFIDSLRKFAKIVGL